MFKNSVCLSVLLGAWAATIPVAAQSVDAAGSSNNAYFQNAATIVGSTNSISITRVPVSAGGKTYYWDVTIPFLVDSDGSIVVQPAETTKSAIFIDSAFTAGSYNGPPGTLNGQAKIALAGPAVFNNSYTEWTISTLSGANGCTYPESAVIYVVPSLSDSPIYSRLKKAGITSNAWSYGIAQSTNCYATWPGDGIIGVSQVGNTLTIASFTYYSTDSSTPVDEIVYTLK